jgi:hypothetical protein
VTDVITQAPTEPAPTVPPALRHDAVNGLALGDDTPRTAPATWARRLRPLAKPAGFYLLSRIGVYFAALAVKWMYPKMHVLTTMGSIWDGRWYLLIAQHGYPARLFNEGDGSRWAFFPAWPALIRGASAVTGLNLADSALALSFVFGLTAVLAVWLAVRQIFGSTIADRTALLFAFFPTAYVLSMGYTEGLFITVAAGCLYCIGRRMWISAALFAVAAGLTRNLGAIVILCLVVAALPAIRRQRSLRPLVACAIAPLGLLAFMVYGWLRVGTPLAFLSAQKFWDGAHFISFTAPLYSLKYLLTSGHGLTNAASVTAVAALLIAYFGLALLVRMGKTTVRIPAYWWVFTIGAVLTAFSPFYPNSILRYTMASFPLLIGYAWKIRPTWEGAIIATMAMSEAAMMMVTLVGLVHAGHMLPFFP